MPIFNYLTEQSKNPTENLYPFIDHICVFYQLILCYMEFPLVDAKIICGTIFFLVGATVEQCIAYSVGFCDLLLDDRISLCCLHDNNHSFRSNGRVCYHSCMHVLCFTLCSTFFWLRKMNWKRETKKNRWLTTNEVATFKYGAFTIYWESGLILIWNFNRIIFFKQ